MPGVHERRQEDFSQRLSRYPGASVQRWRRFGWGSAWGAELILLVV